MFGTSSRPCSDLSDVGEAEAKKRRQNVLQKSHKLLPGQTVALSAIMSNQGRIVTDPTEMAAALRE